MIKQQTLGFQGMLKDLSKSKQSDKYFDAKNIRILATDKNSSLAMTNESGNEILFSIPLPVFNSAETKIEYNTGSQQKSISYKTTSSSYPKCQLEEYFTLSEGVDKTSGVQKIIGVKELRDSVLVVTTDNNGWDCFWELTGINSEVYDIELKYMSNLGFSTDNLLQILFNYENSVIQKVYFVDGKNQLRFINLKQSISNGDSINLIDLNSSTIDTVSTLDLSQPKITNVISGGSHTSGMIQYAYGLYILNGSQTTISPLSQLTPIDKGLNLGGGEVNESLGKSVNVTIENIDEKFTHIKLYSIKYTSYNQIPEVKIVADREIDSSGLFSFTDTGLDGTEMSLEAFLFLGSNPIIPKHITTKDNRLFAFNIKEVSFDVDLDTRAYSYNSFSQAIIMEDVVAGPSGVSGTNFVVPANFNVPPKHDCINADYDSYKYQSDGSTLGATGKYVSVEFFQDFINQDEAKNYKFFKDREIYRIGIKFYNRRGQATEAKWIMDLKAPEGNLEGNYNRLKVSLTNEFTNWLNNSSNFESEDDKPVGYRIIRADRQLSDRTILTQGMINPMVANYAHRDKHRDYNLRVNDTNSNESNKMPSVTRIFETQVPFTKCTDYLDLSANNPNDPTNLNNGKDREGFISASSRDWRAQTYQHNRLMQMFSPEILFNDVQIDSSYKLNVVGLSSRSLIANWSTETNPVSGVNEVEAKFLHGVSLSSPGVQTQDIASDPNFLMDRSFFGPTNGENTRATHQLYQSFNGLFHKNTGTKIYELYGSPEVTESGADFKAYNNDFSLRYSNHLKTMLIDDWRETNAVNNDAEVQIRGCNTIGSRCITFVEGPDESDFPITSRKSIETIKNNTGISENEGVLLAEFVKDSSVIYTGGIYGGNSYEAKKNSSYIEIGDYSSISNLSVTINSPGDTFVDVFTFAKFTKDSIESEDLSYNILSEIVSIKVETSVDLKNRNDLSITEWDNRWQPRMDEYVAYNKVYSQQPTLVKTTTDGDKLKKIQEFDGRIISSKEKIPGEFIDNWTDFLENEKMDLNGQFGPINSVAKIRDEIFCLQDNAVARISVNPRVQTVGSDGLSVELGTGGILHDYNYITTTSGSLNRFGSISTPKGFYYVDLLNSSIAYSDGSSVINLSDAEGFHSEFLKKINYEELYLDNPVLGNGVNCGFNSVNSDVYFTFHKSSGSFTISFNEKANAFVSYYDYKPSWYINKGKAMITTNSTNTQLWEHFKGNSNSFYGEIFNSSITFHVVPQRGEAVLNGLEYKLEALDSNGQILNLDGLTNVRVYNDYQDSEEVELILRKNSFKKFKKWNVKLPRNKGTRDRVRGPWGFVELIFKNPDGKMITLHDTTIFYTEH